MKLVLTCEHAVSDIPSKYRQLFRKEPEILQTHEAYDPGAFDLYEELEAIADFSQAQVVGRLLVETNRSVKNRNLFSRFSSVLEKEDKEEILKSFYHPYRQIVQEKIKNHIDSGEKLIHISVHSFTPVLKGVKRNCDIGLLYDPGRNDEKKFCREWGALMKSQRPDLRLRYNYPYLGKADGFTTTLRKSFTENYLGIELEVNQSWVKNNIMEGWLKELVTDSLGKLLEKKKPQK